MCAASLVVAGLAPGTHAAAHGAAPGKPNIIFIIADDLGWADIGYHNTEVLTPHLDKLARHSVRLQRYYVMPTCTPTRVGLMTGRYPSRLGVLSPAYGNVFGDDSTTLAQALKQGGYETSISGKWHMGSPPECTPLKYGFDSSYGYFHGQIDPYTHLYKTGERSWHRNDQYLDEEGHATDLLTDEAVRVVESDHDKPFFLYVAYSVPHYPGDAYVDVVGYTMNWDSGPVAHPTHPYPKKVFGCVEFNSRFDKTKYDHLDTPRNYDDTNKFRWMRDNLPYASFFMSWDRMSGPYGCGTPESIKAMYNDPAVANLADIDWRETTPMTVKE